MGREKVGIWMIAALSAVGLLGGVTMAGTVEVTPSNMNGWSFISIPGSGTAGTGQMVTGPATPPSGIGSAQLETGAGSGDGAERLITDQFDGDTVASITSLIYSTYDVTNNGQQFPYLKLSVSTTGGSTADDEFIFEPPYQQGSATGNGSLTVQATPVLTLWQTWTAEDSTSTGGWRDDTNVGTAGTFESSSEPGVQSLQTLLVAYPKATIVGGVSLTVGFAGAADNFNGYVDDFTIGISGANTTFDFEPATAVPLPSAAGMGLLVLGVVGVGGLLRKKLRRA